MIEHNFPRLVILDRDGVINEDSDAYIKSVDEWFPIPGSPQAIARLTQAGYLVAVATNQSGLARGYFDDVVLANIHNLMHATIEAAGGHIDALCYCPHGPEDACNCRKPRIGLLEQIGETLDLSVNGAWLIGDSKKDIEAAHAGSCRPILVRTGKGLATEQGLTAEVKATLPVFDDLAAAVTFILTSDTGFVGVRPQ
jgi:D-glycero-D-manno-heptose 1,7-bisphosphate phosphatase